MRRYSIVIAIVLIGLSAITVYSQAEPESDSRAESERLQLLCSQAQGWGSGRYLCCTFYNPSDTPVTFGWWRNEDYSILTIRSKDGVVWKGNPKQWGKNIIEPYRLAKGESKTFLVDLLDGKFSTEFETAAFTVTYSTPSGQRSYVPKDKPWVFEAISKPFEIQYRRSKH